MPLPIFTGKVAVKPKAPVKKSNATSYDATDRGSRPGAIKTPTVNRTTTSGKSTTVSQSSTTTVPSDWIDLFPGTGAPAMPTLGQQTLGAIPQVSPKTIDLAQLAKLYDSRPVEQSQAIGGSVEDQLRQQAVARKAALEQRLQTLDKGYAQAQQGIHQGYTAVGQLLAQANQGFQTGMGSVTADQAGANAALNQSGVQRSQALQQILASQGISTVGGAQAGAAADAQQGAVGAAGTQASADLAGGQASTNAFLAGTPALAAMGEAGGIAQANLMQTLARGQATNSSADAGLAQDAQTRSQDLAYRQNLAQGDLEARRARDAAVIQALTSAMTGNLDTINGAQSTNTQNEIGRLQGNLGITNGVAQTAYTGAVNERSAQIDYAQKVAASTAATQAKLDELRMKGVDPKMITLLQDGSNRRNNAYSAFMANGGASKILQGFDKTGKPMDAKGGGAFTIIDPKTGQVNGDQYANWQKATGGTEADLLFYMAAKVGSGEWSEVMANRAIDAMASSVADSRFYGDAQTLKLKGPDIQKAKDQARADLTKQFQSLLGFDVHGGFVDPTTGDVINIQTEYLKGWGQIVPDLTKSLNPGAGITPLTPEQQFSGAVAGGQTPPSVLPNGLKPNVLGANLPPGVGPVAGVGVAPKPKKKAKVVPKKTPAKKKP